VGSSITKLTNTNLGDITLDIVRAATYGVMINRRPVIESGGNIYVMTLATPREVALAIIKYVKGRGVK